MSSSRPGVVLLAAGRGSRLSQLTSETHKSLLPIAGRPALARIIDAALANGMNEVVVVTGYKSREVSDFVKTEYYGFDITVVENALWAEDTNILSADIGVSALERPDRGYFIVETDVALDDDAWAMVYAAQTSRSSIWFTKGNYCRQATGGCLAVSDRGEVSELVYAPQYQPRYEGWPKLLGVLFVASAQVQLDRQHRKAGIAKTTNQYYMSPWVNNIDSLNCRAIDLGSSFAVSFNDMDSYSRAAFGHETETGDVLGK